MESLGRGAIEPPRPPFGEPPTTSLSWLGELRGRAIWVVLGALVCQLALGVSYMFGAVQKDIVADLGWTRAMFSSARAPMFFALALASPFMGIAAVRFGSRAVLVSSTLIFAAGIILVSRMTELWHFYAANVLSGIMVAGLGDVVVGAVVSSWVVRARGLALGIVYTGSNLAGWIAVPLVTALSAAGSASAWRSAIAIVGLGTAALILPFAGFAVRERGDAAPIEIAGSGDANDVDLGAALRTRSFWILAFVLFAFFFCFIAMIEHTIAFMTDEGLTKTDAASYFGAAIGLGALGKIGIGLLADRLPHRVVILTSFALFAASSALVQLVHLPVVVWGFIVAYGISAGARDVVYPLAIADSFGTRYLAQIYGTLMLAILPGGSIGPVFAALSHDWLGSYRPAFAVFALLNLLSLLLLTQLRDERRFESPLPTGEG